jgi:hypothetical protein
MKRNSSNGALEPAIDTVCRTAAQWGDANTGPTTLPDGIYCVRSGTTGCTDTGTDGTLDAGSVHRWCQWTSAGGWATAVGTF